MTKEILIWLIPLPPLLAFFIILLLTRRHHALSHSLAVGAALLSWLGSMVVFFWAVGAKDLAKSPFLSSINWLPTDASWFRVGVAVDPLTAVTLFFVAW